MLMGLRVLEIICGLDMSVNQILGEIYNEFGYFVFDRTDYKISPAQKDRLKSLLERGIPETLKSAGAEKVITIDGYKYIMNDGSWIMIRPSGTESVVRVYTEGGSEEKTKYLQELGKKIIDGVS
jgi:phosphomannomutase